MRVRRRTNLLWGLIVLVIALVVVAQALGLLPVAIYDIVVRSWPVLLVIVGLSLLLRGRVPVSNLIAVIVSLILVGGIAVYAYSSRAQERRTDNTQPISQPLGEGLGLLRVRVNTLGTDVEILRAVNAAAIEGSFVGSTESVIDLTYEEPGDGSATFTLRETRPNSIPMLAALGRGHLSLEVPPDIPVDIELIGADGEATLNLRETALERLNLDLARGNALVVMPNYKPILAQDGSPQGTLAVRSGDITVVVPSTVAARLDLDRGGSGIDPEYDPNAYNFLFNRLLEARAIEVADTIIQYNIVAPSGHIRLQVEQVAAPAPPAEATELATEEA
jgi:hypothetical protein